MVSTTVSSVPVTSWWYSQGHAGEVARRLESLSGLSPSPGPAGVVTARRDELTVTFVEGLKAPLPQPWQPAGREARIGWEAVDPGSAPDLDHPVYLVVFGTTDDGALVGLNLAAFPRIRIEGDSATAAALVSRWVLELLTTHPEVSIGVTDDVWRGPWTTRVQPVAPGRVPAVDVLVCGAALTYAERAQIVAASTSPILLDLGHDAAVSTTWVITCGADQLGQISRGPTARPMTATLLVEPGRADLISDQSSATAESAVPEPTDEADGDYLDEDFDNPGFDDEDSNENFTPPLHAVAEDVDALSDNMFRSHPGDANADAAAPPAGPIDFFGPAAAGPGPDVEEDTGAAASGNDHAGPVTPAEDDPNASPAAAVDDPSPPAPITPAPFADAGAHLGAADPPHDDAPAPVIAPIWNRILGQAKLCPPHNAQQEQREKRLHELVVFLQQHPWASRSDIIRGIYGQAEDKTVTHQLSLVRKRLGVVRPGGPDAFPRMKMGEGGYHLDPAVRSDWMEFERLVEILVETTPTPHLIAAMELVTGPPLGGVLPKEWPAAKDLREELRDRVPATAAVLARRHHNAGRFGAAVDIARKGLWYDNIRQDLWHLALEAARAGHDNASYRELRRQFLDTVPGDDRDPAVVGLTTG